MTNKFYLDDILASYWDLAFDEGKNGTNNAELANECLYEVREFIDRMNKQQQQRLQASQEENAALKVQVERLQNLNMCLLGEDDKCTNIARIAREQSLAAHDNEVIDKLGVWLMDDMEKELRKIEDNPSGPMSTDRALRFSLMRDVADRIKFFRNNVYEAIRNLKTEG